MVADIIKNYQKCYASFQKHFSYVPDSHNISLLTHFSPMSLSYNLWKRKKTL